MAYGNIWKLSGFFDALVFGVFLYVCLVLFIVVWFVSNQWKLYLEVQLHG